MTNKEIEKRFFFDLEMGLFKKLSSDDFHIWFETKSIFECNPLCELLNYAGFECRSNYASRTSMNHFVYIGIIISNKTYSIYSRYTKVSGLVTNPIPEYVREYSIRDNF